MINGELVDATTASLKVNDLALLRGYGAFDFFLVKNGTPIFAKDHIDRFFYSAKYLKLSIPYSKDDLLSQVRLLIEKNGVQDAGMRLQLTGGYTQDSYTPINPNILILQSPYSPYPAERYQTGIKLMLHNYVREMPEIKTTNYTRGIWLLDELKANGATDLLYHRNDLVSESARSNFFMVDQTGKLITPDSHILKGITRKHVIEVASKQYPVEIRPLRVEELAQASEAFLTSTIKEILPVTQIDDITIGSGLPGPITKKLSDLFETHKIQHQKAFAHSMI